MTAREHLADVISFTECCNCGTTPDELLDAYRAEVLREAADWLTAKYGVTNRAAGDLRRLADTTRP